MITPKKSLGQHFLRDANIARKIVRSLQVQPADVLLEIGSGAGALTQHLVGTCKHLIGVELDRRAAQVLRDMFGTRMEVLEQDILTVDLTALSRRQRTPIRVVGNIPYYLTSEILFWLFEHHGAVRDATLMMQYEVARRLAAKPKSKEYGILSVVTKFYAVPELLFKVPPTAFYPAPEVDSAVVRLTMRDEVPRCDRELFHRIVRATFGKRRKTLRNTLRSAGFDDDILKRITLNLGKRAEELDLDDFIALVQQLEPYVPVESQ